MGIKVELLVARACIGKSQNRGDIIEVDADEAKRMIEAGQAVPCKVEKREKAVKPKAEKRIK